MIFDKDTLLEQCKMKRQGKLEMSWEYLNAFNGKPFANGEALRCWAKRLLKEEGFLPSREDKLDEKVKDKLSEIELQTINLQKERVKLRDLKTKLNKTIRDIAREENICDLISKEVQELVKYKPLYAIESTASKVEKTGIVQLSDWHYSLVANNFHNTYNKDVFHRRINQLVKKIIELGYFHEIEELVVLLQGDYFSSSIHEILRVQNEEDLITQIMTTSEVLAEILTELSLHFKLRVSIVTDNHSRVTANKKESLKMENYIRITEWYLKTSLKSNKNINIIENKLGCEISMFDIYDFKCCSVHGHQDTFNNIVQKLSVFIREIFDFIFTSHNHHLHLEEVCMTTVLSNGGLAGVDEFSTDLRMASKPMQLFSIIDKVNGLEHICPIYVS